MFGRLRMYVRKQESGQVLIQVAVMLVVLLGFVALAIDVGNVYAERRRMQNAADAGALAGARELCLLQPADVAKAKAKSYMKNNGAEDAKSVATITGNVINTTAEKTANTFFAAFAGFPTLPIKAEAAAACGAATSACGLWPVGFSKSLWDYLNDSGLGCGANSLPIVIWSSQKDSDTLSDVTCIVNGAPSKNACDCYECDLNNDKKDDFVVPTGDGRAWLDFSGATGPYVDKCTAAGCGASELACHIRSDSGAQVDLSKCITADSGAKTGIKQAVEDRILSDPTVNVALYSGTCSDGSAACSTGAGYRISSFGCINILEWDQNFVLVSKKNKNDKIMGKVIKVKMNCNGECATACGNTDGTPAQPWQLKAISLTK